MLLTGIPIAIGLAPVVSDCERVPFMGAMTGPAKMSVQSDPVPLPYGGGGRPFT